MNEEVKVKTDFIKAMEDLKEVTNDNHRMDKETVQEKDNQQNAPKEKSNEKAQSDEQKCNSCDFEPRIPGLLKGHNIAHMAGQYQCM